MYNDDEESGRAGTKDYTEPPPAPLIDHLELKKWSFYRAVIAEFIGTTIFLYITIMAVAGYKKQSDSSPNSCLGVSLLGVCWSFGGTIFLVVYCTAGVSGGHVNPAVTLAFLLTRRVTLIRAVVYGVAQCLGAILGVGLVKALLRSELPRYGGGVNTVSDGYSKGVALGAEIIGTFVLVYVVLSATDPKRNARDSHVPVLAPLPIGFAVFVVHLATIPITGTGINPARSLATAVVYRHASAWREQWIFWVGPFVGSGIGAIYHQVILRGSAVKALVTFTGHHL